MPKLDYPPRIFSFSDCHGSQKIWNPLKSPDAAARLAESIRSDFPEIVRLDTLGAPIEFYHHITKETLRLHQENPRSSMTGIFINSAPRTEPNNNGKSFYVAKFKENLIIVATPIDVLSAVKKDIKKLSYLPKKNNGLYDGEAEQHRSSFTPRLLAENHRLELFETNTSLIPELPAACTLSYIDRFGNLVISDRNSALRKKIQKNPNQKIRIQIGKKSKKVGIGNSLSDADPGSLVAYQNDGCVEIICKWHHTWSPTERLEKSAYRQFNKPKIGEKIILN